MRYANDFVMLFQYKSDTDKMYDALPRRMGKFGLKLAMDKTKTLPFGRFTKQNSKNCKTETFGFLGFAFSTGATRSGKHRACIRTNKEAQSEKTSSQDRLKERRQQKHSRC
ncbi:hypothetical protein [Tepidanaerobacter syntrophicus]|uniref:hypothetical protein n=1 Tax=Tepidanaerobacter syntrophicus TaxID=224999 RepID=UPI001BD3B629|nr:hypothetical protein [Tepidanaerobacter syntrophicus]